ncbi:MarR family winged helix-turn-helix transcriptional regulator [Naasia lichenicola]|uniref:MarR family winged helix-turn-helix transcriptional regulator n=1 Tax=Naasia lichenicola TaxID=2565933 RepID=UPI0018EE5ADB|nr:MarR family transcriptional regulator [Naasia lichenicola]
MPSPAQVSGPARSQHGVTLLYLIKQVELAIRSRLEAVTREVGLTVTQYTALTVLERRPGLTSAELARNSFVTAQSMSVVTAELEERLLVEREQDPAHQRRQLLSVTTSGHGLLERLRPDVSWIEEQMVSAISVKDADGLRQILEQCRFALGGGWPR